MVFRPRAGEGERRVVNRTPYLYFKGSCEAALTFYAACGLGQIKELRRYQGSPMAERDGPAWSDKVLHSVFEGPGIRLCASDGPDSEPMKGCALFLENDDPVAAASLQFGVQWAVNSHPNA